MADAGEAQQKLTLYHMRPCRSSRVATLIEVTLLPSMLLAAHDLHVLRWHGVLHMQTLAALQELKEEGINVPCDIKAIEWDQVCACDAVP